MAATGRRRATARRLVGTSLLVVGGVVAGLGLLVLAEIALHVLGVGDGMARHDPFAGFSRVVPMFVPATRPDGVRVMRVSTARRRSATGRSVAEESREFTAVKTPGTFRVFVVGGSSAAGVPYRLGLAFSGWLARRLAAALPDVPTEVVSAAISGYGSRRVLAVVREIAAHEPDAIIVYSGHNEFAERRFYAHLIDMDPRLFRLWERLASMRLFAVLSRLPGVGDRPGAPPERRGFDPPRTGEMFAVLTERAEGKGYATPRERTYGELLFRFNLEAMAETARGAGARLVLLTLGQNLADWPPGASEHRAGLAPSERALWDQAVAEGDRLAGGESACPAAIVRYRQALAIDDEYAALHFRLAACARRLGRWALARRHYRRASDLDRVPHGAPSRLNTIVRDVAAAEGAILVDVAHALEEASPHGLVGDDLFVDFVHPNVGTHQRIAAAVAAALAEAGVPAPRSQWRADAYVDPSPASLYAADPRLRRREWLVRAVACDLARRRECALAALDAILAEVPTHPAALRLRDAIGRATRG